MIKNIFHCCFTKTQTVGAWNIKSYKPAHYTNYVPPKGSTQYKQYADDQRLTFHASEGLTGDEFTKDGGRRDCGDLLRRELDDVAQEFEQSRRLRICRGVRSDAPQQGLSVILQNRQFEDMCRVEDGIGIFLIWEYIPVLSPTDTLPSDDCILRHNSARTVVTYHPSQHSVV